MSLLAPLGLAGLIAIPLIVLFHMRHTTPPQRPVPSLRFWQAINPRPAEERRLRRPPLTLPLLLQIAAAALLAFALARPATAAQLANLAPGLYAEPRHLILLLDGSTSMSAALAAAPPTSVWDAARQTALDRLGALREGDVATVILMGTRPVVLTATDGASLVSLRERLATLPQPGGRADLDAGLSLAGDLFLPNLDRQVVIVSDGALTADATIAAGVDAPIELVIPGTEPENARANLAVIDMAARANPGGDGTVGLYTSLVNYGPEEVTVPVVLYGDGLEIGRDEARLLADGDVAPMRWLLPPGVSEVTVRIERQDALAADNRATLLPGEAATGTIAPRILLVTDLPGALARALGALENVQLAIEPSDNEAAIAAGGYDLVVFDRAAPPIETVRKIDSPTLWIAPPVGGPFAAADAVGDPRVTRVRAGDPLLAGVDLSGATFGPTPAFVLGAGDEEIVGGADGPLLYRTTVNDHPAVVLTVDPETSNLPKRVAFPVLVANLIGALAPDGVPAAIPLGEPLVYEPRAAAATVEIVPPSGETVSVPVAAIGASDATADANAVQRDVVYTDTGTAGTYTVTELDEAGAALGSTRFVVNAGHPRESDLRPNAALAASLLNSGSGDAPVVRPERVDLWPLFALAVLVVVALEWIASLWPRRRVAIGGIG
jgi:Ca-activated chloride channel homolog